MLRPIRAPASALITASVLLCIPFAQSFAAAAPQPESASPPGATQRGAQARPDVERQRQQAEQQARITVDPDAAAAIQETHNALKAIAEGKKDQALAAIERATGKINVLVARKPATGLLPVDAQVTVIDVAPIDSGAIRQIAKSAERAVKERDYPEARVVLYNLASEIRVRTYHLPLATYPAALDTAARLLDQGKNREAEAVLRNALNTLVVIDRVLPIPIVTAQAEINAAEAQRDKDKASAQRALAVARAELERARELGYAGSDPEYAQLTQAVSDLEKQVEGNENTTSAFAKLKERVASFFKRLTGGEKRSEVAGR
ncbi:MAG TPA: YfdX family protein [Tepidisphaeraceae bacterium]|jgi:hypothetical protein